MIWYATNKIMHKNKKEAENVISVEALFAVQKTSLCGQTPLDRENVERRYPLSSGTFLIRGSRRESTAFWSALRCSVNWYFCRERTRNNIRKLSCGHRRSLHPESCTSVRLTGIDGVLPPSLCRRFLPPGAWVSSSSSS